jgi:hypothetical protein
MNFWRAILASLLSLVCTLAVSTYVSLQTLDTTVLNRDEVKGWLDKSGVYSNLLNTVLSTNATAQQELTATSGSAVTADDVKSALDQTMNASYIKQSSEKALDSAYDWLNGKTSSISFEINTTVKKDAFIANLSSILQPQLAQLPTCTSTAQFQTNNPPCLPPNTTPKQAADELATDAANQASVFRQPVTDSTIANASNNTSNSSLTDNKGAHNIQSVVSNIKLWLLWLPIIAVLSGGLMVLLSQHRLKAAKHLAGKLTWGLAITCAIGLLVARIGKTFTASSYVSGANNTIMNNIVEPVIHQAAPAIGNRLALVSGILGLVTLALWITFRTLWKNQERAKLLAPDEETPPSPTKTKPAETTPASPTSKTSPSTF